MILFKPGYSYVFLPVIDRKLINSSKKIIFQNRIQNVIFVRYLLNV